MERVAHDNTILSVQFDKQEQKERKKNYCFRL